MRFAVAIALFLALAACDSAREPAPDAPPVTSAAEELVAAPAPTTPDPLATRTPAELVPAAELVGEWRVAGVDGEPIDQPYAITASIDGKRIHVVADCINLAWDYAAESGTFEAKRVPVEGCGRGLTTPEALLAEAIDSATGFGRTPSNAIEIFSQDHRVTLYSQ